MDFREDFKEDFREESLKVLITSPKVFSSSLWLCWCSGTILLDTLKARFSSAKAQCFLNSAHLLGFNKENQDWKTVLQQDRELNTPSREYQKFICALSSCKPGFGVDQLQDDNLETYWQSDGSQPHLVNIQFRRKTTVKTLCIYVDYKSDESYTPSKISVRVGNNFHNLQEIRQLELVQPSGWIHVPLTDNHKKPTRTFMIQIAVLANHQNGRDTHMRQIKIYTPVEESSIGKFPTCTTTDFMMYRSIR
ncbi:anaphase-promoting complex subunit 10-like [Lagenorhynchus albirostris]|uniref:anaphase-promoting complex subunit 10-like n=1 Tax=Lagenorhynchus albirostris TaxID=27610 RepID=UPI0028E1E115|nr:anaphase-promoting complex subunit 10-like [Lagenorhynchus albirostris]